MKTLPRIAYAVTTVILITLHPIIVAGSAIQPLSTADQITNSAAVFRGKVVGISTARGADGLIYTRTSLLVNEALKGNFPTVVAVEHRGGQVARDEEFYGLSPKLLPNTEYLLFVKRNGSQKLECTQGHASAVRLNEATNIAAQYESPGQEILNETRTIIAASRSSTGEDVTDQAGEIPHQPMATTGMLNGVNSRFLQPDRGEPIPVLIDAASLPAGMTLSQATNAVIQALNAWAAVTSLKFKIESVGGFGQGADTIVNHDEKLRIQLHDNYGRINTVNVLGIGGRNASSNPSPAGWESGGNVAGNEFRKSTYGYVVLEAGDSSMQNTATFAEVLCHEIGHALNMAHSSEVTNSNPLLFNSIMYFQVHADGRGATLGAYDPPIIRQCYPSNTVPFVLNPFPQHRVIDATTASSALNLSGINEVEIRGYDQQTVALSIITNSESGTAGTFSLVGNTLKFNAPVGNFLDSARIDPHIDAGGSFAFYRVVYYRFSDGTNASPYTLARVISLCRDGITPLDGLPNYWMINYFGNATPSAATLSRAIDDADGDGLTNLQEYRAGTNPKEANSRLRISGFTGSTLQFSAQAYEHYEILSSTNLTNWSVVKGITPSTNSVTFRSSLPQTNITATASNLITTNPKLFYRISKVP